MRFCCVSKFCELLIQARKTRVFWIKECRAYKISIIFWKQTKTKTCTRTYKNFFFKQCQCGSVKQLVLKVCTQFCVEWRKCMHVAYITVIVVASFEEESKRDDIKDNCSPWKSDG